ncbi:SusC/RagA family TonB-linked outer membrane protein [Aestuariibaculum suncheonense]|uniref:TonB-dependent receptor n=1 Tax=Aestuariibaculum suncheonense TaxID=1028745 RepID=A0A8J6UA43_9FLAO|nr:TonB-dependent receptor [Aestuariibaculum suncheonense]MBD0834793.1 TonB-dependent receptor [Aestuariibaculum suncheonense]
MNQLQKQKLGNSKSGIFLFVFLVCNILWVNAQNINVRGQVLDSKGVPLPGVNLLEKGTNNGSVTDFDGEFTISVKNEKSILVLSYIGFKTQEVPVKDNKIINIVLEEDTESLDEIVIVGYGQQNKVTVTGAISSIGTEELTSSPSASVANALAGKVTGLNSIQYSGQPGADSAQLFIRGVATLSQGNSQPLIMVDGVERSFTQIDPEEISDITILKDASATAVYGIRGANGVVLVTTKRGKVGEAKISAGYSYGIQSPVRLPDFVDSYTYATIYNRAQLGDGIAEEQLKFSPEVVEAFRTKSNPVLYSDVNWMDYVIRSTSPMSKTNFNVSGGTEGVRYFMSASYLNQEGMFNTFGTGTGENFIYKRYNYRSNIDIDVTKTTELSFTLGGRSEQRQEPEVAESQDQLFRFLYRSVPYSSPGIVDGKYVQDNEEYIPGATIDALSRYYGRGSFTRVTTVYNFDLALNQNLDAITKGLKFGVKGSYNRNAVQTKIRQTSPDVYTAFYARDFDETLAADDETLVFPKTSTGGRVGYSESYGKDRSWYLEATLNYNRRFGDHEVSGLLLYNQRSNYYPGGNFNYLPSGYVGSAARATYNYKRKYMAEVNIGYNGSENFARNVRYGFFPAYSLGWVASEESFLKNNSVISYLKLRASYGKVGSDNLGSNRFLYLPDGYQVGTGNDSYNFGVDVPSNQNGYIETRLGNPLVTWETAIKQNYGFDLKLFNNKLALNLDYFIENREDILTTRNTVPSIVAVTLPAVNIGKVHNEGYEINLRWDDKIGSSFNYWINPNMSYAKNEIVFMDEIKQNYDYQYRTGQPVGQPFGYIFSGFYSEDDFNVDGSLKDTFPVPASSVQAGDAIYQDINGDGFIDTQDQKPIGFSEYPQYTFGLNAGFKYKNFDFRMSWVGTENVSRILGEVRQPFGETDNSTLLQWFADNSWTPETADTATLPRITFNNRANNFSNLSELYQLDASYIRLKTLEIGYNIKSPFIKKIGIKNLRLYSNGYNLLTFDKLDGLVDPESGTGNRATYPAMKIYNVGVNLNF